MILRRIFVFFAFITITSLAFAAPAGGPGGGTGAPNGGGAPAAGGGCWPPPCIPIDGGISLLIAAGAIYGGRKLYQRHKDSKTDL